jgi:hypothetical protein
MTDPEKDALDLLPTEAALLLDDAALFTHERVVFINLARSCVLRICW